MKKLFEYWKGHTLAILMIICLLIVQAYCDLSLPGYTSDIVDVGITNGGIENAAIEKMSVETYSAVKMFVSEEDGETLSRYYKLGSQGLYVLKTDKKKDIEKIDKILKTPFAIMATMTLSEEVNIGEMMTSGGETTPKEEILDFVSSFEEKMSEYGDNFTDGQSRTFIREEYKKIGVDTEEIQRNYLIKEGLLMIGFTILGMIASIFAGLIASVLAARVGMTLRNKVFKKVISYSNAEMDKFSTASLITRSTNDIQQVQMVTVLMFRMILYAPVLAVGGIIKVLSTDTGLEWIIVLAVILILGTVSVLMAIALPKFRIMQNLMDKLNLVSREILTGVLVIRAFSREKTEEDRFEEANNNLMKTQLFTNRVMTFMMPVMMFVMNCVTVLIVWMSAKGIDTGRMQVGDMMAFITYAILIVMSFLMLTMIAIVLPRAGVAAERINEVITTEPTIHNSEAASENDEKLTDIKGVVEFNNVSFKYPGADENVLENISFKAEPGKTTAIIGSTGCGKSTLIHLIPRFFDATEGTITIDGVNIKDISQHKLRESLGYVPQKGVLFSGNIESNIKFAGDMVTDEDMKLAAEISQSMEFINEKEDKFQSEIAQGGTNVSGGQRQRLSIARAIAKKPKVILFDDSFSALDYKTDVVLRKALKENLTDSTVIIVAQRISTILHADNIIVLEDGKIMGMGTHEELLTNCEAYQEIAKSQLSEKELKGGNA